jgi:hypothetical protein
MKISFTLLMTLFLAVSVVVPSASAVSTSTNFLDLFPGEAAAYVNSQKVDLTADEASVLVNGTVFIPLKFVAQTMGIDLVWNAKTSRVEMNTPGFRIEIDIANNILYVNKVKVPLDKTAMMRGDTLLVKLSWVSDYMGGKYEFTPSLNRAEIIFVKRPDGVYDSTTKQSNPVAKFTFGKPSYRIGEPVKYIDLSYDPDSEGIADYTWTGNREAFFAAGTYPVTLQVADGKGLTSDVYTRNLVITDEVYTSEFEYPLYFAEPGSFIPADWGIIWEHYHDLPELPRSVTYDSDRKLIVSDSPEDITEKGILYQDIVKGKVRLYADHVNTMIERIQFAIMVTNNTGKPVTVKTTNKGEVYPSAYANLIGHEASVDFMIGDPMSEELIVPPNRTVVYVQMPDFYPGQGVNAFYDVETDGEVTFSFLAMDPISTPVSVGLYKPLDYVANVRGTFEAADVRWDIDASSFDVPSRLIIGDGESDLFIPGYDVQRKQKVTDDGNYGVMYEIHALNPRKMVILLLPRGGYFKGPFKFNGEFMMAPASGLLPPFEGVQVLARTTGNEGSLDIEFTPPAGSAFPVDLIFYPLEDK